MPTEVRGGEEMEVLESGQGEKTPEDVKMR
jgi:hypothetical protein